MKMKISGLNYKFMIIFFGLGVLIGSLVQVLDILRLFQFAIGAGLTLGVICSLILKRCEGETKITTLAIAIIGVVLAVTSFTGMINIVKLIILVVGCSLIVGGIASLSGKIVH